MKNGNIECYLNQNNNILIWDIILLIIRGLTNYV